MLRPPPRPTLFPYTTLFRSGSASPPAWPTPSAGSRGRTPPPGRAGGGVRPRSEEHTSELQSRFDLVCRLLLEKKKQHNLQNLHILLLHPFFFVSLCSHH